MTQAQYNARAVHADALATEHADQIQVLIGQMSAVIHSVTELTGRHNSTERVVYESHHSRLMTLELLDEFVRGEFSRVDTALEFHKSHGLKGDKEKQAMVTRRGLSDVPKLTGESASYHDWVFQFRAFARTEVGFEDYVEYVTSVGHDPTVSDVQAYAQQHGVDASWFDEQLFMVLVNRAETGSKALSVTKNNQDRLGCRGAKSWFDIAVECKGGKGQLRQDSLREAARKPTPITGFGDALSKIRDWEAAVRLYEKEFPDEKISDYEKGNTLKDLVPEELRNDLVRMEKRGFEAIQEYVMTQIPLRREETMRKKGLATR